MNQNAKSITKKLTQLLHGSMDLIRGFSKACGLKFLTICDKKFYSLASTILKVYQEAHRNENQDVSVGIRYAG